MLPKKIPNRLINEKSPYLLQHAHNPVDWWPWCDEAFAKAKSEDKPVFLSIGYSTCHWCHVMARESFEDGETAALLGDGFVSVKVDREQRPDIDAIYMTACQAVTGQGGWPLTALLTADRKPFYVGTYFPRHTRLGHVGLIEVLSAVTRQWRSNRSGLLDAAEQLTGHLLQGEITAGTAGPEPDRETVREAYGYLRRSFDARWGGFGSAPKFPTPHHLLFLLRYSILENEPDALDMTRATLRAMARGGIFDQIGFGFSRYSTDERWLAPHFEKMLYDNALLTIALAETSLLAQDGYLRRVAENTLDYLHRELKSPGGGFFCAQDADSDAEEGAFYLFNPEEVESALGLDGAAEFCMRYDISATGNFDGKSIPNLIGNPEYDRDDPAIEAQLPALREFRKRRHELHRDEKILPSWNGLAIAAHAVAGRMFDNGEYLSRAGSALSAVEADAQNGLLDDCAFVLWGMLELYAARYDAALLCRAASLARRMIERFWDSDNGGFFLAPEGDKTLLYRPKELFDNAMPSGNSVAAMCLARLAELTAEPDFLDYSARMASSFGGLTEHPAAASFFVSALMPGIYGSRQLVCALPDENCLPELCRLLHERFRPDLAVVVKTPKNAAVIEKAAPFTAGYHARNGQPTFYLCRGAACSAPVIGFDALRIAIDN